MSSASIQIYHTRLQRVLRHIEEHLDDDLDVETLSGIAAFSKHHFHRQFSALFGIGAYKYVQLLRLKRASYRLAFRDDRSILAIALESGYEGPEAFARAFRQQLGQTPSEFRRQPNWGTWHAAYETIGETRTRHMKNDLRNADVKIVDVSDTRVAALEHRGDPALIEESVRRFIAWRREAKLPPKISGTFNVWYNSPLDTPPDEFRFDLCAATEKEIAPNVAGIVAKTIPGGRCAMLRHIGTEDSLGEAVSYLYADWLPRSGEEPRDFPLYFQRISFFPDVAEHEAITDIFLPLK